MATQKPTSTISYNSETFLKEKLESWYNAHIIQAYMYIRHKGEDGDKDHIHLYIEPNRKLDVMELSEALKEYPIGVEKPLGVRPWRPSREPDWILYAVHDEEYLALKYGGFEKGEKIPYDWHDIVSSPDFDVEIAFIRAKATLKHSNVSLLNRLKGGESSMNLVSQGENVFLVNALTRALNTSEYQTLKDKYDKLAEDFYQQSELLEKLTYALKKNHLDVVEEADGTLSIVSVECDEVNPACEFYEDYGTHFDDEVN